MDHTEYIVEIKKVIKPELIKKIIPFIDNRANKNLTVEEGLNTNIRNVKGHTLKSNNKTDIFYFNLIKLEIERLYMFYKVKFPFVDSKKINQIDILKYSPGGKYNVHTDDSWKWPRQISVIINLNNDYEGGDLVFTDQQEKEIKRLKLNKGSIVFFPSNFMYPHGIQSITKGTRYSIVAWLE